MLRELQKIREQQQAESDAPQKSIRPPTQPTKKAISALPPSPRAKTVPPSPPSPPPLTQYPVNEGETLWSIAARKDVYADPLLWPIIYKANRDQIKDPRRIYTGQTLSIPRSISPSELEDAREKARQSEIFPVELLLRNTRKNSH